MATKKGIVAAEEAIEDKDISNHQPIGNNNNDDDFDKTQMEAPARL